MITEAMFFMGRDKTFAAQLTVTLKVNAADTISKANKLLAMFYAANPKAYQRGVNSGWRPPQINSGTKNASTTSLHMLCMAVDLGDDDEVLDTWLMTDAGQKALTDCELWMEHPSATPRWSHVQTRPPRSGRRVFYP